MRLEHLLSGATIEEIRSYLVLLFLLCLFCLFIIYSEKDDAESTKDKVELDP